MGIRPKGTGEKIILTDTHRDLVDDVTATTDEFGTVLGEGINEIAATAQSANASAGELATRVKTLEETLAVGRVLAVDSPADLSAMDKRAKVGDYIYVAATGELYRKVS